jgi:hypothetical protein
MTELRWLEQARKIGRADKPPAIDVTAGVMHHLPEVDRETERPLAVMAAISAIAAVIVAAFAMSAWSEWQDPLSTMLNSLNMVLR